jgi:hypothetical protein
VRSGTHHCPSLRGTIREESDKNKDLGEEPDVVLWFYVSQIKLGIDLQAAFDKKWIINRCEIRSITQNNEKLK